MPLINGADRNLRWFIEDVEFKAAFFKNSFSIRSGRIDVATAPTVWRKVHVAIDRAARSSVVVLDLSGTSFLDSLGITALVNLNQRSRRQQVELRLVAEPGRLVRRVLTLAGVDTLLTIHDSLEDARTAPPVLQRVASLPPPVSSPLASARSTG